MVAVSKAPSLPIPKNDRTLILILVAIYLLTRLPLLQFLPLVQDENLHSIMAEEQAEHLTLIPTFMGYPVSWKPAPFIWAYSALSRMPLPIEARYRLPSLLFGLITIPPLFLLLRNLGLSRNLAFFSILMFLFSLVSLYPDDAMHADAMAFFFTTCSLYLYTMQDPKIQKNWMFVLAALFAGLAFLTKLVVAFIIPVLAVVYFYDKDKSRKTFRNPFFLLSLLVVPLLFILYFFLLESAGLGQESYVLDIVGKMANPQGIGSQANSFFGSFYVVLVGLGLWFALSLFGFKRYWKGNLTMAAWYVLTLFPFLTSSYMPWYYLPVMPAIAYFAAMLLIVDEGKERTDGFFAMIFGIMLVISAVICLSFYSGLYSSFLPQKEAGLLLAGKENVIVLGSYAPGIISYKMITEIDTMGRPLDIGWILYTNDSEELNSEFLKNYSSDRYPVRQGSFSLMFHSLEIFRKDTNITKPEYVVTVYLENATVANASLIYNRSRILVYDVR